MHGPVLSDPKAGKFIGTPDGVDAVAVAVVCGAGVAAQADPAPLSKAGDATISVKLTLLQTCASPRVLVRERHDGKIGGWLAATGR